MKCERCGFVIERALDAIVVAARMWSEPLLIHRACQQQTDRLIESVMG